MAFTNRHYQTVAEAMAEARRHIEFSDAPADRKAAALLGVEIATTHLADALAAHHRGDYSFKRGRFLAAAGFPEQ